MHTYMHTHIFTHLTPHYMYTFHFISLHHITLRCITLHDIKNSSIHPSVRPSIIVHPSVHTYIHAYKERERERQRERGRHIRTYIPTKKETEREREKAKTNKQGIPNAEFLNSDPACQIQAPQTRASHPRFPKIFCLSFCRTCRRRFPGSGLGLVLRLTFRLCP